MWRVFQRLENGSFVHICYIHVIDFQNHITDSKGQKFKFHCQIFNKMNFLNLPKTADILKTFSKILENNEFTILKMHHEPQKFTLWSRQLLGNDFTFFLEL